MLKLTVSHPKTSEGFVSITYEMPSEYTNVNCIRQILQSWASIYRVEHSIKDIVLQLNDGIKITYGSIQTKRGLARKQITFEELFERGGKIMY